MLVMAVVITQLFSSENSRKIEAYGISNSMQLRFFDDSWSEKSQYQVFGKNWIEQNAQLITRANYSGEAYTFASKHRGLFKLTESGLVQDDQLEKRPMIFDESSRRSATGIDPNGRFITHKHSILFKTTAGFKKIKTDHGISQYFTAVFSTQNRVYVGTTLNGLYVARYNANTVMFSKLRFRNVSSGLPGISHDGKYNFYDQVLSIQMLKNGAMLVGMGIQGGIYYRPPKKRHFKKISWRYPSKKTIDVYCITLNQHETIAWASTSEGLIEINSSDFFKTRSLTYKNYNQIASIDELQFMMFYDKSDKRLYGYRAFKHFVLHPKKVKNRVPLKGQRIFYSSALNYSRRKKSVLRLLKSDEFTGMVIDLKDDHGRIRFKNNIQLAKKMRSTIARVNLKELSTYAKKYNKHLVARIVSMKDRVLWRNRGYAVYNRRTGQPWTGNNEEERWVDPFNSNLATKYFIPLIKEIENGGIDEIQLDYIRFPTDGSVGQIQLKHKGKQDIYRSEGLENFLYQLRENTDIVIGADLFGYNGIYVAAGLMGQDIEVFAPYVDVISPMLYPSLFGNKYLTSGPVKERTYRLLYHCALRYNHIAQGRYLVRPFLQGYPSKTSIWGYGKKFFIEQIQGGYENGVKGFLFWGSFKHMRHIQRSLKNLDYTTLSKKLLKKS